jgi:hypothetical protein
MAGQLGLRRGPRPDGSRAACFPLRGIACSAGRRGDELLGALSLQKPANELLTTTEDQLLQHPASQADLLLRNVADMSSGSWSPGLAVDR